MNNNSENVPEITGTEITVASPQELAAPVRQSTPELSAASCRVIEVTAALAPAYGKAGTLELSDAEIAALTAPFPDDVVEIRPHDGMIYIPHIHISDRFNKVLRPGKWALIRRREWIDGSTLYAEWVLVVRGAFVGEAIGAGEYHANNPRQNYSDVLEATAAEALRRIAGKRLSVGSQVWDPEYARQWVSKYAIRGPRGWAKRQDATSVPAKPAPAAEPTAAEPAPQPTAPTVQESAEEKRQRWIKLCREAGGGNDWPAETVLAGLGRIEEFTKLDEIPAESVPKTKKEADALLQEIRKYAAQYLQQAEAPASQPSQSDQQYLYGRLKVVTQKPTKDGSIRYGMLIIGEPNQPEKETWVNTFDTTDGERAMALKGQLVQMQVTAGKFGFRLVEHTLSEWDGQSQVVMII